MKITLRLLLYSFFTFVFIMLFPSIVPRELVFVPQWAEAIPGRGSGNDVSFPRFFRIGERFGYFDEETGEISYVDTIRFNIVQSDRYFINFDAINTNLVLEDYRGRRDKVYHTRGYPLFPETFTGESLLLLSTNRSGITHLDESGEVDWERNWGSPITSVSFHDDSILVGTVGGELSLFGIDGTSVFEEILSGSLTNCIYGTAFNPSGGIAVVKGLDPQQLIYYSREREGYAKSEVFDLEDQFRTNRETGFLFDGDIFTENPSSISVFSSGSNRGYQIPFTGTLTSVQKLFPGLACIVSADSGTTYLHCINESGETLYRLVYSEGERYFSSRDNWLFSGVGNSLGAGRFELR